MQEISFVRDGEISKYSSPVLRGDGNVAVIHLEFASPTRVDILRNIDPANLKWAQVSSGVRSSVYEESIVGLSGDQAIKVVTYGQEPEKAYATGVTVAG